MPITTTRNLQKALRTLSSPKKLGALKYAKLLNRAASYFDNTYERNDYITQIKSTCKSRIVITIK